MRGECPALYTLPLPRLPDPKRVRYARSTAAPNTIPFSLDRENLLQVVRTGADAAAGKQDPPTLPLPAAAGFFTWPGGDAAEGHREVSPNKPRRAEQPLMASYTARTQAYSPVCPASQSEWQKGLLQNGTFYSSPFGLFENIHVHGAPSKLDALLVSVHKQVGYRLIRADAAAGIPGDGIAIDV